MSEKKMLIGSLSNDLYRVASLTFGGSHQGALRFFDESKKWTAPLLHHDLDEYIEKIVRTIDMMPNEKLTKDSAEDLLMYSVLLQNYSLRI